MNGLVERNTRFMGCSDSYEQSAVVITGVPMDFTVSFRPGSRFGPQEIRQVSFGLEEYSYYLNRDLRDFTFFDYGDLILPYGNIKECLKRIGQVAEKLFSEGKFPLVLGGEHLISLPFIEKAAAFYPGLALIHLDAHADLREDYMGEVYSHATVIRRAVEAVGGRNVYQFGIRSGDGSEFAYARKETNFYPDEVIGPLKKILQQLGDRPVYVTMDIDVVDPAYAPGTGTAEPGGITSREALQVIHLLGQTRVIGFDLVEVSPPYDATQRTSLLAAKLVREIILSFGGK
ncbi:agmatinase [Desulfofarcimen acetoxidans DSM 771]|jgi:agmatinase|uniref:Agmatinase n=1 Tax=Desulfofarcimen acetoxidans (strain ATCC 49208 / DSM 771 / KCTC 5769 / VKM B-1644 / 5575) TaxID=485916 RepID=C8VVZ1_DESAS|nr:agmatinase [Desulfofarcimen acetoxidans]ACV64278.1 agmatinase [Desulfofarcimen acetoxidans DSM 771]